MSYDQTRDAEQLRVIDPSIDDFIDRYNNSNGPTGGQPRQTVFFFPGGMGSRLKRAKKPYLDGGPSGQMFNYHTVWLTFDDFLGEVLDLAITKINGEYRDKDSRIIVADGTVDILGWTFYDGFTDWCEDAGLDYFIFGWDWRRRLEHSGEFFITQFLPYFQERVRDGCNNADALANFSLIGHSAGGMVINWILRESWDYPILTNLQKVITVATPFYGYADQLHRWFEGDANFNWDPFVTKDDLIRVICSLPACYAWLFMDEKTFDDNEQAFKDDQSYPLLDYPSKDKTNIIVRADPYNPLIQGPYGRYPAGVGFCIQELAIGHALVRHLSSGLHPTLAAKFFNIRGDDQKNDTVGSTTWNWVPPTNPSPIDNVLKVPGDGTQPAWSARHLDLLALGQVITVKGSDVSHMHTMNSPKTLDRLGNLLGV